MRGEFRPSHYCGKRRHRGKNFRCSPKCVIALFALLIPMALLAQSNRNSIYDSTESTSIGNLSQSNYSSDDHEFSPDARPTAAGGGLERPEALPSATLADFEGVYVQPAECVCSGSEQPNLAPDPQQGASGRQSDSSDGGAKASGLVAEAKNRPDRNLDIYYRNRREFSLDVGWHPVNVPFIYDFAVGDDYTMTPLKYTLVPIIASLRWHVTNVGWRSIFRGNMDFTFSGSITAIPRGPETHYYSFDFGIRRNFVYRNWKVVPFFEQRGGIGIINAKEPLGVLFSQGQNLTFTYDLGVGARYNIDSKYSFSAGMNYMHISNGYLSQPQFTNYGINVYGPMFGFDVRLGKPRQASQ